MISAVTIVAGAQPGDNLTAEQWELLRRIGDGQMLFSRGRAFLMGAAQVDLSLQVQVLRARKLVILHQLAPGRRVPPTREYALTEAGRELLKGREG